MTQELYKKYRPKTFERIFGQSAAVASLEAFLDAGELPHTILLHGPAGCGKTTLARILKRELGCGDHDFAEVNCADFTGVDTVRMIRGQMHQSPMSGDCRIWLIDEAHMLSAAAQNALLKMLEDTPEQVYFFLATTVPQKLLRTIRTRATEIKVVEMTDSAQRDMIHDVLKRSKNNEDISGDVLEAVIKASEGSARKALVILDQVYRIDDEEKQLEAIANADDQAEAITIARTLFGRGASWKKVAVVLKAYKGDPETVRWVVLGYANTMLVNSGSEAAFRAIRLFEDHWYESKKAGLSAACFEFFLK